MRRLWFVLAVVAACACRDKPTRAHTGIVVYQGPQKDTVHWALFWVDLATGKTGRVGYEVFNYEPYYVRDRTVAWLEGAGKSGRDTGGTLRVSRNGTNLAVQFIPELVVRGVSPDEQRAAVGHKPGYDGDVELVLGKRTPTGFERGKRLGVGMPNTTIFGWLRDGSIAADRFFDGGRRELLRLRPGAKPSVVQDIPQSYYLLSHDTRTVAWLPYKEDGDDDEQVILIAPFTDHHAPRKISLGRGEMSRCEWAPDDRTLGCEVMQMPGGEPHYTDAFAVDVASGKVTRLGTKLGPGMVFSPDGRSVMLFDEKMTIVPVDGKGPRVQLKTFGAPVGWIR